VRTRRRYYKSSLLASLDNKTSLALVKSSGVDSGLTAITRATTGTLPDFEGLIRTAKAGEIRLAGARRVENLITRSENISHASWLKTAGVTTPTAEVCVYDGSGTSGNYRIYTNGTVYPLGNKYACNVEIRADIPINLRLNGNVTWGSASTIISVTANWQRFSMPVGTSNGSSTGQLLIYSAIGDNTPFTIYIRKAQAEDVTGQANQNPSEYVSNGVLSAPYHNAGADGVKVFNYQNGNTVASNVVTEAQGATIAESSFLGALVEPVRTQLYLNSATLVTQNNTVTAQAYTASFYGTGTVTFSGAYVGSLVGTGANNRVSLTFTPSAGTLTSTVSGSCTRAQLEAGSYFSSYVASVGASVTRNADIETIPTTNFNTRIGKIAFEFTPTHASVGTVALGGSYIDASNYTQILHIAATGWVFRKRVAGVDYDAVLSGEFVANTTYKIVVSWSDTAGVDIFIDSVKGVNHINTLPLQLSSVWQIGSDGNSLQQATGYFKNVVARKNNNQTVILANTSTPLSPSFDFTTALNLTQLQITGFL